MPVLDVDTDAEELTLTVTAEFAAPVRSVWRMWSDPRELERWWGPPACPATFEQHDFRPGGDARYVMTGPGGDSQRGWWKICAIDEPNRLEFEDGFADRHGKPATEFGVTHAKVTLEEIESGTRMVLLSTFASVDQLDQMVSMGMAEGIRQSVNQIDHLLVT